MEEKDLILLGGVAIGGLLLYNYFNKGTTPQEAKVLFSDLGYHSDVINTTPQNQTGIVSSKPNLFRVVVSKPFNQGTTTYFFNQENLDKFNWAQKFLLNIGVPTKWVLE